MGEPLRQAKRPVTVLAGPYGHPLHPALVALPIGAWVASLVFDVASLVVADGRSLTEASMWLIGLGVLGAVAAASVGFLDLAAIPTGTRVFRIAIVHMALNVGVTVLYGIDFALRRGQPASAEGVNVGLIALSAAALGLLTASGYLGGELAYRFGVRVADEQKQAEGYGGTGRPAADGPSNRNTDVRRRP
jgi:uncharacterized membrane protein